MYLALLFKTLFDSFSLIINSLMSSSFPNFYLKSTSLLWSSSFPHLHLILLYFYTLIFASTSYFETLFSSLFMKTKGGGLLKIDFVHLSQHFTKYESYAGSYSILKSLKFSMLFILLILD